MRILFESELRATAPEVARATRPVQGLRPPIPQDALADTTLVVNAFDGGPRTRLSVRIGNGEPTVLARTRRLDPFVVELFQRYPETKKNWVQATPSSHIWTARLPDDLAPGAHRVAIEGTDEYGVRSAPVPCWKSPEPAAERLNLPAPPGGRATRRTLRCRVGTRTPRGGIGSAGLRRRSGAPRARPRGSPR